MAASLRAGSGAGTYLNAGVIHLSLTNFLIIVIMLVVFVAALVLPFPHGRDDDNQDGQ